MCWTGTSPIRAAATDDLRRVGVPSLLRPDAEVEVGLEVGGKT